MSKPRKIYGNNSIYNSLKKHKILRVNLTQDVNDLYKENLQTPEERAQERLQKVESSPMLMEW
jgi:hypothetical protein